MRRTALAVFIGCLALFAADTFTQRQRDFWSFQKVKEQTPPAVRDTAWAESDRSLHAREARGQELRPSPPADKVTLLRRATFDLIGLPPTPEEIDAFLADKSPHAFEKVSTACSRRRITASAGAATGSTWRATPRAKASRPTRRAPTPGAIATT